jgi:dihydroorotate dehydrogenase
MPDWSYHTLFRPILHRLPAQVSRDFIHRSMSFISSIPFGSKLISFLGHFDNDLRLSKTIGDVTVPNPLGLSGEIDPSLIGTKAFTHLGWGFIEIGPITVNSTLQNDCPLWDRKNKRILFPEPLPSIEVKKVKDRLKKVKKQQPFLLRLRGTNEEIVRLIQQLFSYGDGFIIETTELISHEVLRGLRQCAMGKPIILSVKNDINLIRKAILPIQSFLDGIVVESDRTWTTEENQRLLKKTVHLLKQQANWHLPIVIKGGVQSPNDALELLHAGADFLLISDGYIYSGPGLPKRILESLLFTSFGNLEKSQYTGWQYYWWFGLIIFLSGILAFIFSVTSVILPYDEAFLNTTREQIYSWNPQLLAFMSHDRMTLAGTMISGGILYMFLAKYGVQYRLHWTKHAIDVAGIIGFLGFLLFIGYGYFDFLHLSLWMILIPFFLKGMKSSKNVKALPVSFDLYNDRAWKQCLWGQLAFISLGVSLVFGGVVIALIGTTTIFVPTDLAYICMTPEMLNDWNERLIPVIAHDRAGFGSALCSVGTLILLISLWGFRRGASWVWRAFFIGGIPAFVTGIGTHFWIGYTTLIHLVPAYIALFLYIVGLLTTYRYLHDKGSKIS